MAIWRISSLTLWTSWSFRRPPTATSERDEAGRRILHG